MNKTKALVPLEGGARPSIIGRSRLPGVRLRILFVLVSLVMPLTNVGATPQDKQCRRLPGYSSRECYGAGRSSLRRQADGLFRGGTCPGTGAGEANAAATRRTH